MEAENIKRKNQSNKWNKEKRNLINSCIKCKWTMKLEDETCQTE